MVVGGDASVKRHQPRNRQVGIARELIPGDDGTGRNVGTAFPFEEARYRQFINQRRGRNDHFLAGCRGNQAMRQRLVDRRKQRRLHPLLSPKADRGSELSRLPTIGIAPASEVPATLVKCNAGPLSSSARQPATSYSSLTGCEMETSSPASRRADMKARIDCRECIASRLMASFACTSA